MHETIPSVRPSNNPNTCITDGWVEQVGALHVALEICPADLTARKKLAALLEELWEWDGALFNWRRILAYDPNNLEAWEGIARCRRTPHKQEDAGHNRESDVKGT